MRTDSITLTGLRVNAHHGVFDFERQNGQDFIIDVTVWLDLRRAASGDDLARTVHYGELAIAVTDAVAHNPVDLIETVAERVAGVALGFEAVERVRVTVHKPEAPIPVPFLDVSVQIERTRADLAVTVHPAAGKTSHGGTDAVLALGSNLGDRAATLAAAVAAIASLDGASQVVASPFYESDAVKLDGVDVDAPLYLNGVVTLRYEGSADELLDAVNRIEHDNGRVRVERWGDRTLDIDLIVFGQQHRDDPRLTLPHPRAAERDFVLVPWLALDAHAVLPGAGRIADLVAGLDVTVRRAEAQTDAQTDAQAGHPVGSAEGQR